MIKNQKQLVELVMTNAKNRLGHALAVITRSAEAAALRCVIIDELKTGRPLICTVLS